MALRAKDVTIGKEINAQEINSKNIVNLGLNAIFLEIPTSHIEVFKMFYNNASLIKYACDFF